MSDFGLFQRPYHQAWLYWLVQALVAFTYCFHCYQSLAPESYKEKIQKMDENIPKKQEQPGQQAHNTEKKIRIKQGIIQLFGFLHKGVVEKTTNAMEQTETLLSVSKQIFQVLRAAFLRESYLVSLVGLYMCGLTAVNLLNAGYSVSRYLLIFLALTIPFSDIFHFIYH